MPPGQARTVGNAVIPGNDIGIGCAAVGPNTETRRTYTILIYGGEKQIAGFAGDGVISRVYPVRFESDRNGLVFEKSAAPDVVDGNSGKSSQ